MDVRFPLKDVDVRLVAAARTVEFPLYADKYWQMNQREFAMQVGGWQIIMHVTGGRLNIALLTVPTGTAWSFT